MDSLSEKGPLASVTGMREGINCVLELPQDDETYLLLEEEPRFKDGVLVSTDARSRCADTHRTSDTESDGKIAAFLPEPG